MENEVLFSHPLPFSYRSLPSPFLVAVVANYLLKTRALRPAGAAAWRWPAARPGFAAHAPVCLVIW